MLQAYDEPMRPDQYLLVSTRNWARTAQSIAVRSGEHTLRYLSLRELHSEQWIPVGAPGREWLRTQRHTGRRVWLLGTEDQARADGIDLDNPHCDSRVQAPFGDFGAVVEGRAPQRRPGSWTAPDARFLAGLPRVPDRLVAQLELAHPRTRFASPLTHAGRALRSGLFPADIRTALYTGLLALPGITLLEHVTAHDGHGCVALVCELDDVQEKLLIDADTGHYTGHRLLAGARSRLPVEPGTVVNASNTFTAIVDALDQPAPGGDDHAEPTY